MGLHTDLIAEDLDGIDPREMSEHFRAVAALTPGQLSGMLGWAQQEQDGPVYELARILLDAAERNSHAGRLMEAIDCYNRELHFALDAHEMTAGLHAELVDILRPQPVSGDRGPQAISAEQYERAAQHIACFRNTCGGPGTGHEHLGDNPF